MDVCHGFVLFLVCLSMCVRMPLSSRSIAELPSSRALPYYFTPPVCVSDVIGALAVSQKYMKPKKLVT